MRNTLYKVIHSATHYARYRGCFFRYKITIRRRYAAQRRLRRAGAVPAYPYHIKKPTARVGFFIWWGKLDSDQRSQWQQIYSLPPLAAREFPHICWSWWTESNHQPADYKSAALPLSHTSVLNSQYYSRKIFSCQYLFRKKWFFSLFFYWLSKLPKLIRKPPIGWLDEYRVL